VPVTQRPLLALVLRLGAMFMMATMLMLVKLAGQRGVPLGETIFWRQFVPAFCLVGWLAARRRLDLLRTRHPWLHVRRAVIGTIAMGFTLGVVRLLPLAESTILGFTMPLFAVFLSVALLNEKVGLWRGGAIALGLVGIVVTVGFDRSHLPVMGVAVGLGAAISSGLVVIQLREMSRTEEPITVVCWFSIAGAVLLSPLLLLAGHHNDPADWALMIGIGLAGLAVQMLTTSALRLGQVSSVMVMDYTQFIWAALWGWLVFSQPPAPTTWIGAPLIVAAGVIIARREQILHRRTRLESTVSSSGD